MDDGIHASANLLQSSLAGEFHSLCLCTLAFIITRHRPFIPVYIVGVLAGEVESELHLNSIAESGTKIRARYSFILSLESSVPIIMFPPSQGYALDIEAISGICGSVSIGRRFVLLSVHVADDLYSLLGSGLFAADYRKLSPQ